MGGLFYQVAAPDVLIVDPTSDPNPKTQEDLKTEIGDYEDLMAQDHKFCMAVEGASQESNLWVPRNQNETGLADADLQRFKSLAWNECVVKKFLTSREGDADLVGRSMINIVQSLNLQWKGLHVMGLHPKVEAAERQIVMSCMEESLVPFDLDVGKIARSLRRCHHFSEFFANAVGGQIVANTGRTPGLSKTMYGTDMDYAYKNRALSHLQRAIMRNKSLIATCLQDADPTDYVSRITQLKIIRPEGSVELTSYDDKGPSKPQTVFLDQPRRGPDDMGPMIREMERNLSRKIDDLSQRRVEPGDPRATADVVQRMLDATFTQISERISNPLTQRLDTWMPQLKNSMDTFTAKTTQFDTQMEDLKTTIDAFTLANHKLIADAMEDLRSQFREFSTDLDNKVAMINSEFESQRLGHLTTSIQTLHRAMKLFQTNLMALFQSVHEGGIPNIGPIPEMVTEPEMAQRHNPALTGTYVVPPVVPMEPNAAKRQKTTTLPSTPVPGPGLSYDQIQDDFL